MVPHYHLQLICWNVERIIIFWSLLTNIIWFYNLKMLGCHGLPTSGAELPCCAILVGTNSKVDLGTVFGPGSPQCLWSLLCDSGKLFAPITSLVKLKRQLSEIVIDQKRVLVLLPPDKGSSFNHFVNFLPKYERKWKNVVSTTRPSFDRMNLVL